MKDKYEICGGHIKVSKCEDGFAIDELYVPKEWRGRGVATHLLNWVISKADFNQVPLYLIVASSEKSIDGQRLKTFYRKHGFRHLPELGGEFFHRAPQGGRHNTRYAYLQ